jgi:hypothetical protein
MNLLTKSIISGCLSTKTPVENIQRTSEIRNALKRFELSPIKVIGVYKGVPEISFACDCTQWRLIWFLATVFKQESYIFNGGLYYTNAPQVCALKFTTQRLANSSDDCYTEVNGIRYVLS